MSSHSGSQTDGENLCGNTRANSLKWLKKRNPEIKSMIKLVDGNIGISEDGIITLPLYMAMFIR